MNRIKSYTVIEMLVVMLISSLSIGITYTCYTIFSNHYLTYKKSSDELANYILLDKLLTKDISASKKTEKTPEGICCIFQKENICYEFYDSYILRKGIDTDTFSMIAAESPVFKRLGKIENIPGALIQEINLVAVYKGEKLYFYYSKNYGANILMIMEESDKQ
jgi:hypothetical protein